MNDWTNIQAQMPPENGPSKDRRESFVSDLSLTAASRLPGFSREIILLLFVGVMSVLGLQTHMLRRQQDRLWRAYAYWGHRARGDKARLDRRAMIDIWAGGQSIHWRDQIRARWLASRDINNSPDPHVRRTGFDEWFTKRAYSRVPGICLANIRQAALRNPPEGLPQIVGRSRLKLRVAGNRHKPGSQCLIPP